MSVTPSQQQIIDATNAYNDFDDLTKYNDWVAFNQKLDEFKAMIDGHLKSPEIILLIFFTSILSGPDGTSETGQSEDSITETSKEMNYASAYTNVVSEMKAQISSDTGSVTVIQSDLDTMDKYSGNSSTYPSPFGPHAPVIFQNFDATFSGAASDINSVLNEIGPGKTYSSLQDLISQAGQVQQGNTNQASNDLQTLTNAFGTLTSAVGIQQNVMGSQLQQLQGDLSSLTGSSTQGMKSFQQQSDYAVQKAITN